jgi:hypothetical protein
MFRAVTCAVLAICLTGAALADESAPVRGADLLVPFKQNLQHALKSGLANGPVEAISACRLEAPKIAEQLSQDGVIVGRTSHRLRNPVNASPGWVTPVLERYIESVDNRVPQVVNLPGYRVGYVEPIVTKALCLTCHGETLAPALASRIGDLYPDDRATGFKEGDLRGVFWVEYPKENATP